MQDGLVFFSQKTTRVGFDRCFLSFLMEFAGQRYDFNQALESRAESPGGAAAAETSCCRAGVLYGTIETQILGNEEHPHGFT